ncbi:hypothetical protein GW755_04095 [bacterium]|nr:hypothetical protein [bacterium]
MPNKKRINKSFSNSSALGILLVFSILLGVFYFNRFLNPNFLNKNTDKEMDVFLVAPEEVDYTAHFYMESSDPAPQVGKPFTITVKLAGEKHTINSVVIGGYNLSLFVPSPLKVVKDSLKIRDDIGGFADNNITESAANTEVSSLWTSSGSEGNTEYLTIKDLADSSKYIMQFDVVSTEETTKKNINFKVSTRSPKLIITDITKPDPLDILDRSKLVSLPVQINHVTVPTVTSYSGIKFERPLNGDKYLMYTSDLFSISFTDGTKPEPGKIIFTTFTPNGTVLDTKQYLAGVDDYIFRTGDTEGDFTIRAQAFAQAEDATPISVVSSKIKIRTGDLTGDGEYDYKDLLVVVNWIYSDKPYLGAYDINADGKISPSEDPDFNNDKEVDINDLIKLSKWTYSSLVIGGGELIPPP